MSRTESTKSLRKRMTKRLDRGAVFASLRGDCRDHRKHVLDAVVDFGEQQALLGFGFLAFFDFDLERAGVLLAQSLGAAPIANVAEKPQEERLRVF